MKDIFIRFPQGKLKAFTLSFDDGPYCDRRLMEIFDKNSLKCTFNLNSYACIDEADITDNPKRWMTKKEILETYSDKPHEVAIHGEHHLYMEKLSPASALFEAANDRAALEDMFNTTIRGMAYPYGTYNDDVVNAIKAAGIVYSRTTEASHSFDIPTDWLRLSPSCHYLDEKFDELLDKFVNESPYDTPFRSNSWLFYVWGHSFEFVNNDNWEVAEKFAAKVANHDDIWYATNIEIYDYVDAFNHLIFNHDQTIVTNPTATDLWFEHGRCSKDIVCIKAGETKKML